MPCFEVVKGEANCIEMGNDKTKWCPSCQAVYVVVVPLEDSEEAPQEEL